MEASLKNPERKLDSEKAQRIIEAMRASVGRRGAAGSTFDHVAAEAGVSRGLLHYYFGSEARLLVEVERADLYRRTRTMVAEVLRERDADGVSTLRADAEAAAAVLFALGDGIELQ